MVASTPTSRRIVLQKTRHLPAMGTYERGWVPLTNPGEFKAGVYQGTVNPDGTATLTWIGELP